MGNDLLLLWLAAFPLMGSPGPATMSLAGLGASFGAVKGLPYLAGIVAGTTGVLAMIATGVTGLILAVPALVAALTAVAVGYILYLAWKIATAPVLRLADGDGKAPGFSSGFALAIANPKAFAAIGAVYSSRTLIDHEPLVDAAAKCAALLLVILIVNGAWLAIGASLSGVLRTPTSARILNLIFAALLILSVALAMIGV